MGGEGAGCWSGMEPLCDMGRNRGMNRMPGVFGRIVVVIAVGLVTIEPGSVKRSLDNR